MIPAMPRPGHSFCPSNPAWSAQHLIKGMALIKESCSSGVFPLQLICSNFMCIAGHFSSYQIFATPQNTPHFPPKSFSFHSFSLPFFSFRIARPEISCGPKTTFSQTWHSEWFENYSKYIPQINESPKKKKKIPKFLFLCSSATCMEWLWHCQRRVAALCIFF